MLHLEEREEDCIHLTSLQLLVHRQIWVKLVILVSIGDDLAVTID